MWTSIRCGNTTANRIRSAEWIVQISAELASLCQTESSSTKNKRFLSTINVRTIRLELFYSIFDSMDTTIYRNVISNRQWIEYIFLLAQEQRKSIV